VVDTHCHLDLLDNLENSLANARAQGLTRLATVGMDGASIRMALSFARRWDEVFAIVGRHPNSATGFDDDALEEIERATADPLARAVGETGLDYYRDSAPRDDQKRAFEAQLDLAARTGLPVVVHTRQAEADTFAMLRERDGDVTVVLHCFSSPDRIDECIERGYVCSFAGNVTYPKSRDLQRAAKQVPDELLLVETDAPFLAPQVVRGKPNEPANVTHTARFVAELRGVEYDELDALVERNAARVFGW
jgi:TatD DNase family protein